MRISVTDVHLSYEVHIMLVVSLVSIEMIQTSSVMKILTLDLNVIVKLITTVLIQLEH